MTTIAALQPYVIGPFLLFTGVAKVVRPPGQAALAGLVGQERVRVAMRAIGAVEIVVAAMLVAGLFAGVVGAVALSLAFLAYLAYARIAAPGSSCGCLGARGRPVGIREFARAGFILAASLLAAGPHLFPASVAVAGAVAAAEVAVLLMFSPELDRYWLFPARQVIVRLARPLRPAPEIPLDVTLSRLRRSPAFCSFSAQLRSDVLDSWDDEAWRFITFAAGPGRTVVFAVPLAGFTPDQVRSAVV